MTDLPMYYAWNNQTFEPIEQPSAKGILVADSWRVRGGATWGLADHIHRFVTGVQARNAPSEVLLAAELETFEVALRRLLYAQWSKAQEDLFPRISLHQDRGRWRIELVVRPAPQPRDTTSLWIPPYTDPRAYATIKGPDISLMRGLVAEVAADDIVLHDGTFVHEATTGALMVWYSLDHLVLCQASRQLASISVRRIADYARSQGITVTTQPVTLEELVTRKAPVWFSNTLHGISPVTTIGSATGETQVAAHPDVAQWQAAWWADFADDLGHVRPMR